MIVVITSEEEFENQVRRLNNLLIYGLHSIHIRFPNGCKSDYTRFINSIDPVYRHRLVVCNYFELVEETGVGGVHLNTSNLHLYPQFVGRCRVSVSAHSIDELENLPFVPTYALLSPVFDSISKQGYAANDNLKHIKQRLQSLPFPVLALGGFAPNNQSLCYEYGFAGGATLGYISDPDYDEVERWLSFSKNEVLSVAGHDPCGGAGITKDAEVVNLLGAKPLTVCSTLTVQHDTEYKETVKVEEDYAEKAISHLLSKHYVRVAKIGLCTSLAQTLSIAKTLKQNGASVVVWDTILKPSASDVDSMSPIDNGLLQEVLRLVDVVTPNYKEAVRLFGENLDEIIPKVCSSYDCNIVVKSMKTDCSSQVSTDVMYTKSGDRFEFMVPLTPIDRHGTGCVYSSTLATHLSFCYDLYTACRLSQLAVDYYRRYGRVDYFSASSEAVRSKLARLDACKLMYITNGESEEEILQKAEQALRGGCNYIQLRMKNTSSANRIQIATKLRRLCNQFIYSLLVINDDIETALQCDADGVHLGKNDMSPALARKILGHGKIIGGTCNTEEDIYTRSLEGVDYIGVGPYRFTTTKQNLSPMLGLDGMKRLSDYNRKLPLLIPMYAIGGIVIDDVKDLLSSGVQGVAVSGLIDKSHDAEKITKDILKEIKQTYNQ
ncbi:MAG: thiamine phosphate synthase [Bacteroides sp.]|nr:thiamine phosphate synthase [Bacteroides sp.]